MAVAIALSLASCAETGKQENVTNHADTMVLRNSDAPVGTPKAENAWARVDWKSPVLKYDEVTNKDIDVRGNDQYGIYGLGENVLFETGKADIRSNAEANLAMVAKSIKQRYNGGKVKVFGDTDATGDAAANTALSRQRAEAVKSYLSSKGNIAADRIEMYAEGEERPVASNDDASGRMQNRRVEVVAMKQ